MNIEVTEHFVNTVNRAAIEWNKEPKTGDKYVYFDVKCLEQFGIKVKFSGKSGAVLLESAEIVDEEKYIWFLLTYGQ
jgi:hypothetical protein